MGSRNPGAAIATTKNPHTVSQVVLRRFSKRRRWLARYDVATGVLEPVTTRDFGATAEISLDRAPKFEKRWRKVEDQANLAIDAVCQGKPITDPRTLGILLDLVAMHVTRTLDLLAVNEAAWRLTHAASIPSIAAHPATAESFRRRHAGIEPVGRQALELEAGAMLEEAIAAVDASNFTARSMLEQFAETRRRVARAAIEIVHASEGEFLISDAPAQTLQRDRPGVGVLDGISMSDAGTIVMPVARHFAIALGRSYDVIELDRAGVEFLNRVQVLAAHNAVAWHPDVDLHAFADAARTQRHPRVPIISAGLDLDVTHHLGSRAGRRA